MIEEAIILAGGFGTRLQTIVKDIPKPLADIGGKPFLLYVLEYLKRYKINRVILGVGYKYELIKNFFGNRYEDIEIVYSVEQKPLGTGGAIRQALKFCENDAVLICNGDTYFNVDLRLFFAEFLNDKYNVEILVALKRMHNFDRYGVVEHNENNRITGFKEKTHAVVGDINGGVYLFKKNIRDKFPNTEAFSIEKNFMESRVSMIEMYCYISDGYFIDIGVPEDYFKAQEQLPSFLSA